MAKKQQPSSTLEAIKKAKRTKQDEAIEERLTRCAKLEAHDIVYVGQLVERTLKGEFGAIIKALTAGRISMELDNRDATISSERRIGRLEMANNLWNDLEQFVHDKDKMQETLKQTELTTETFNYQP